MEIRNLTNPSSSNNDFLFFPFLFVFIIIENVLDKINIVNLSR